MKLTQIVAIEDEEPVGPVAHSLRVRELRNLEHVGSRSDCEIPF